MSERTAPALAKLDALLPLLAALPATDDKAGLIDATEALRRAVAAFHMEAIRFRMHSVDRLLKLTGDDPAGRRLFEELRQALETAGFHTRSHVAPPVLPKGPAVPEA
jgi:hypothetical protein